MWAQHRRGGWRILSIPGGLGISREVISGIRRSDRQQDFKMLTRRRYQTQLHRRDYDKGIHVYNAMIIVAIDGNIRTQVACP